jgi:hypothetical protein
MRNYPFGGSLFTGVGAYLELMPTDQNGNRIPNVTIIESVSPSVTIQNPNPVKSSKVKRGIYRGAISRYEF